VFVVQSLKRTTGFLTLESIFPKLNLAQVLKDISLPITSCNETFIYFPTTSYLLVSIAGLTQLTSEVIKLDVVSTAPVGTDNAKVFQPTCKYQPSFSRVFLVSKSHAKAEVIDKSIIVNVASILFIKI